MIDRVSTASLYETNLSNINITQTNLAQLNEQISSGNKANTWDQLNGTVEQVSGYTTKISNIDNYTANNTVISTRLNTMDQSLSTLQSVATQYASLIAQRSNQVNGSSINFSQQANSMLDEIASALNVQISGRYLFSGSKTETPPITTPISSTTTTPGTPNNSYYNGDSAQLSSRVSDTQDMQYGVTGDNPAFQQLIGAIQTGLTGDASSSSSGANADFSSSVDMINQAINSLADVKTGIDTNINDINNITDQNSTLKLYWQQALSDDTSTDVASASIQLAADQTTLQATFQAFASISKLNLTSYLN